MSIEQRIRRANGGILGLIKRLARRALCWHIPVVPAVRPLFKVLYRLHVFGREALLWTLRFLWFEPLFRSQCEHIGSGFRMEQLPYLHGRGRLALGNAVRLSGKSSIAFSQQGGGTPELVVGDGTFIGHACSFGVAASIRIGRQCLIAGSVSVRDWDGHPLSARDRAAGLLVSEDAVRPVVIGDQVWVGSGARILKGVTIGARSIIGTGAVVSRDVPADSVVAGNPARVVRSVSAADAGDPMSAATLRMPSVKAAAVPRS